MDVRFVNPFVEAAIGLFAQMFSLEVGAGKPCLVEPEPGHGWSVSGLLGVAGDVQGVVALRLTRELAADLLARSGVTFTCEKERKEMTGHLVGEMTNIVSAHATDKFGGVSVEIAPPVVISGEGHQISWPPIGPVIGIPFACELGAFEVDLCLKER